MPFFISDVRPQGFWGRMEPGRNRKLDRPADISRWTTEQVLKYISRRSEHAAGDLILGNESYGRYLESAAAQEASVIPDQRRGAHYPRMAEDSMQGEAPGSSVGGEQPKFTAIIRRADDARTIEHVIVKFSPKITTSTSMRWGDLLVCEHLALLTLSRNGIAAARTAILELEDRVFREVVRFDRVGLRGRLPMATFSALDGDLGMMDQNWTGGVAPPAGDCAAGPRQRCVRTRNRRYGRQASGHRSPVHGHAVHGLPYPRHLDNQCRAKLRPRWYAESRAR